MIELILTVQRQWMYLENIFLGEDIRKQVIRSSDSRICFFVVMFGMVIVYIRSFEFDNCATTCPKSEASSHLE